MSVQHPERVVTKQDLKDFYDSILPYLGGSDGVQSDWTEADSTSDAYILHKPNLATVATSGDYADLSNKPANLTAAQINALIALLN